MIKGILIGIGIVLLIATIAVVGPTTPQPAEAQSTRTVALIADLPDARIYTIYRNALTIPCFLAVSKAPPTQSSYVALACP